MRKQTLKHSMLWMLFVLVPLALVLGAGCSGKDDKSSGGTFSGSGSGYYDGPMKPKDSGSKTPAAGKGSGEP